MLIIWNLGVENSDKLMIFYDKFLINIYSKICIKKITTLLKIENKSNPEWNMTKSICGVIKKGILNLVENLFLIKCVNMIKYMKRSSSPFL